jgi:hypothetical protein
VRGLGETVEKQMVGNKQMNHYLLRNGSVFILRERFLIVGVVYGV